MLSSSVSSLALSTLVFRETGSALLTAWTLFGGPLIALVGTMFLLNLSDRLSPRTGLALTGVALAVSALLQLLPGLPFVVRLVVLAIPWLLSSATGGAKWKALRAIVPDRAYLLGRSTVNLAVGSMQFVGFGVGGLLLPYLGPRGLFILAAGMGVVVGLLFAIVFQIQILTAEQTPVKSGVARSTIALNKRLMASKSTRVLYIALWVPNGIIVGCEALFLPLGGDRAGLLLAMAAAGMMTGDILVGRLASPGLALKVLTPLRLLLSIPYLLFFLTPTLWQMSLIIFIASIGYAASLPLQGLLLRHTEESESGHVLGLHSSGLLVWQGIGATLAGLLAGVMDTTTVIVLLGIGSALVTVSLVPALRNLSVIRKTPSLDLSRGTRRGLTG